MDATAIQRKMHKTRNISRPLPSLKGLAAAAPTGVEEARCDSCPDPGASSHHPATAETGRVSAWHESRFAKHRALRILSQFHLQCTIARPADGERNQGIRVPRKLPI